MDTLWTILACVAVIICGALAAVLVMAALAVACAGPLCCVYLFCVGVLEVVEGDWHGLAKMAAPLGVLAVLALLGALFGGSRETPGGSDAEDGEGIE